MPDKEPLEALLATICDRRARDILAAISREPQSANELADRLDLAPSTVYGRIDELRDYDLVTGETKIAEDGNHYQVFTSNFDSTLISLEDDGYEVRIFREGNLPDRFDRLWDELSRS